MCGLVSIVSPDAPIDERLLRRALDTVAHRGPDGQGIWISADRRVALAHRRLAIVDRGGGAQPIANEDGSIVAIVNGEIYEEDRLRAGLRSHHRFRTRCDSEWLVHLYEERGIERTLREIGGELAFVLWDDRRRVLYAGRDRFGIKPLCYARIGGALAFASEAKALFALGLPARWDAEAYAHAASFQYPPTDRTLFAEVRAVPPAAVLVVGANTQSVQYWDLPIARDDASEASVELRARLGRAVEARLRAEVPVAAQLSGGIDSTSIAALARVPCFTVRFPESSYDESALALRSAEALGLECAIVDASDRAMADVLSDAVYFAEGLAINVHLPAKLLLARAIARSGFRVVLSGEGADEALLGYPHFRADLGHAADDDAVRGLMMPSGATHEVSRFAQRLGVVPTFLAAKAELGARIRSLGSPALEDAVANSDPFAALTASFEGAPLAARAPVERSAYLWTKLALGGYILRTLGDGTEMAASIEGRTPFLDPSVFEFAASLPIEQRIDADGLEKRVLREAMRGLVPEEVRLRRKHPFVGPPLAGALEELLRDVVEGLDVPFFDRRKLRARLDRSCSAAERKLWDPVWMFVLTSALLQRRFRLS